jgi:hypothetical protein
MMRWGFEPAQAARLGSACWSPAANQKPPNLHRLQVSDYPQLYKVLTEALMEYNETHAGESVPGAAC